MITREQVEEARTELKQQYLQYYKDNFGIEVGAIVICRDTSSKNKGRECLVTRIEIDLSYLPSSPTFYVTPKNKGGEWSKSEIKFYWQKEWKLKR